MKEWRSGWVDEWVREWMKWVNEWINEWIDDGKRVGDNKIWWIMMISFDYECNDVWVWI